MKEKRRKAFPVVFFGFPEEFRRAHSEELRDIRTQPVWVASPSDPCEIDETVLTVVLNLDETVNNLPSTWENVRNRFPSAELVAVSSRDSAQLAMHCLREGFSDFLTQPVSPDELALCLLRSHQRDKAAQETATQRAQLGGLLSQLSGCSSTPTLRLRAVAMVGRLLGAQNTFWLAAKSAPHTGVGRKVFKNTRGLRRVWLPCRRQTNGGFMAVGIKTPVSRQRLNEAATLAEHAELVLMNLRRVEKLKRQTLVDDLTGLYNSRYLRFALEAALSEGGRNGTSFALLFIDIDRFKQVNDSHGHLVGSNFLSALARIIKNAVRREDAVFRYGGDEFVILLRDATISRATEIAERLRSQIDGREFTIRQVKLRVTVSIGIATFPDHAKSVDGLIEKADSAMYQAKQSRNRVCLAPRPSEKPRRSPPPVRRRRPEPTL